MKLVANRRKDQYHLVEALKIANQQQVAEAVVRLRTLHPSYLQAFKELLNEAEEENRQEQKSAGGASSNRFADL